HHVDDGPRAGAAAVVLSVENAVLLVDAVEVPQQVGGIGVAAAIEPRGGVGGVERDFHFVTARGDDVLRMHRRSKGEHEKRNSERARQDHRLFWTSWTTASRMGETRANDKKKF